MAKGRKTGGRAKGTRNRATEAQRAAAKASGLTPLDFLLAVVRDRSRSDEMRVSAAKAAAQFCHPALKAIEHTGKDGGPVQIEQVLTIDFE